MEIKGEYRIAASRDKVFAALNDVAVLQSCIPGCESLVKSSDTEMLAKVRLRIGPVSASFSGKVKLSDIDQPKGYRIIGEGQGGAAGFAKGGAVVTLRPDGAGTILAYDVDAQVGGKIAQVGARLIDGTARKLADEFFGKFAKLVGEATTAPVDADASSTPTEPTPHTGPSSPTSSVAAGTKPAVSWQLPSVLFALGAGVAELLFAYFANR